MAKVVITEPVTITVLPGSVVEITEFQKAAIAGKYTEETKKTAKGK